MPCVRDILTRKGSNVISVSAAESVLKASQIMNDRAIGGVVVLDQDGVAGIFTERDILRRVVAERRDPATTAIRDVMTTPVTICHPETTLAELGALMTERRIRHLPVVDANGLCGVVTSGDVLAYQVADQEVTIEHLNRYVFDLR
jgi:CBS domain-containing protein